jgi:hypothetical protein
MPAQYRSFYEQWKTKTILFDPQVAARGMSREVVPNSHGCIQV